MASNNNFYLAPGEDFVQCPYNTSHSIINTRFLTHLAKCRASYIAECKKAGKSINITKCCYNFTHQYPKPEMEGHERICPDRYTVIPFIAYHQSDEFREVVSKREAAAQQQNVPKSPVNNGFDFEEELATMTQQKLNIGNNNSHISHSNGGGGGRGVGPAGAAGVDFGDEENWDEECADGGYSAAYDPATKISNSDEAYLYVPIGLKPAERRAFREQNRLKALKKLEMNEKVNNVSSGGIPKAPVPYALQQQQQQQQSSSSSISPAPNTTIKSRREQDDDDNDDKIPKESPVPTDEKSTTKNNDKQNEDYDWIED